jgi:NADPH2:quinone reductase
MKAAFIHEAGPPEVIQYGDVPQPTPKEGEVSVRILAAPVNPVDALIRSGKLPMKLPRPFVIGCDFGGTVASVGPDVSTIQVGARVWGSLQGIVWDGQNRQGAASEYATIRAEFVYRVPDGVSEQDAAAVGLPGLTAHLGLFRCARLQAGETVFVNGGAGVSAPWSCKWPEP